MPRKFLILSFGVWVLASCSDAEEAKKIDTHVATEKVNPVAGSSGNYADELRQWLKDNKGKPNPGMSTMAGGDSLKDCPECPEMVNIPAGSFMMGSESGGGDEKPVHRGDEKPVHRVEVSAFAMGKYEITFDEYDAFAKTTGRSLPEDQGWGRGKRPVINISWVDATAYTEWLSQKTGKTYRLPTEAEWEYAARAGTTTDYWWGNTASHEYANYGKDECCSGLAQGKDQWEFTAPVGSFGPNPFGLYDTAGNVWEWTCSCYTNEYDGNELKCDIINEGRRVLRGGSWLYGVPNWVRVGAAARNGNDLPFRLGDLGVRVVGFTR